MTNRRPRGQKNRREFRLILIGSEGSKNSNTEIEYFKNFARSKSYRIKWINGNETDPVNLVNQAVNSLNKESDFDTEFGDKCYILLDADTDKKKNKQIEKAMKIAGSSNIKLIISVPTFEVWLLLHFEKVNMYLTNEQALKKIKKYISNYKKGENCFDELKDNLQTAISNAKQVNSEHIDEFNKSKFVECNPYTDVYKVIEDIQKMNEDI